MKPDVREWFEKVQKEKEDDLNEWCMSNLPEYCSLDVGQNDSKWSIKNLNGDKSTKLI